MAAAAIEMSASKRSRHAVDDVAPSTPGPAMAAPPSTPATFAALENAAQQPIDYHDLTSFEVEAAINSSITLLSERIKAPIETPKRATFSFASKVKSFLSSTPSFLRFGGSANNSAAPESPPRSHPAGPTALLTSPTAEAEGKENTVHRFGQALENVEMAHMGQLQVPAPVFALIMDIRSRGLYHEGLFRIAGNKRRVKVLRKFYDAGEPVPEAEAADASVHDYADLLKEYLRVLPDPLIGTTLTPILLAVSRLQDTLDAAQMLTTLQLFHILVPARQRDCLQALGLFLADVAAMSHQNKMKADNLAKVFMPNICKYDLALSAEASSQGDVHTRMSSLLVRIIAQPMAAFAVPRSVAPQRALYNSFRTSMASFTPGKMASTFTFTAPATPAPMAPVATAATPAPAPISMDASTPGGSFGSAVVLSRVELKAPAPAAAEALAAAPALYDAETPRTKRVRTERQAPSPAKAGAASPTPQRSGNSPLVMPFGALTPMGAPTTTPVPRNTPSTNPRRSAKASVHRGTKGGLHTAAGAPDLPTFEF